MFGVGFFEIIIIAVFALVFVGPKRLPEVMRQAGRLFVHIRRTANDVRSTFDQVIREAENEIRREEADSLRNALKPVTDARNDIKALLTGNTPAPGTQPQAAPAQTGVLTSVPGGPPITPPAAPQAGQVVDTTARAEPTDSTVPGSVPYTPGGAPAPAPAAAAGAPSDPAAPAATPTDASGTPKETV